MDQTKDQNPVALYRVNQIVGTPDFVLDSPVLSSEDCVKYASTAFGDPARREFPIFNKASTWVSYAYLRGAEISDPLVEGRIKKAAEAFGILAELEKIDSTLNTQEKSASAQGKYALPAGSIPDLPAAQVYPIKTAFHVEESARQLLNDRNRVPVLLFYKAASRIAQAAVELGANIPDAIKNAGVDRYPDFGHAAKVAEQRRFVVKNDEALELYRETVKSASAENAIDVHPYIDVWVELDRAHGVKYAKGILDPYAAFYAGPTKEDVEKAANAHVFILNVPVPADVVAKITDEQLDMRFTKSAAASLKVWRDTASTNGVAGTAQVTTFSKDTQKEILRLAMTVE